MGAHPSTSPAFRLSLHTSLLVTVLCLVPISAHAQAQWMPNGLPVCVIPGCSGHEPILCGDGAGGAVIAWDRDPTLSDQNIFVHRVLYNGQLSPTWPPKGTPATRAPGDQYLTDIATDSQGGAFVVWYDFPNYDIYAQHVLGDGAIAPGWPVDGLPVCTVAGQQNDPRLLADGAGGVFIAWTDQRLGFDEQDIYALHLMADGTRFTGWPENGLGVCTAIARQGAPCLGSDGQGGCFVTWSDGRNCNSNCGELFAQRVTRSGEISAGWPANGQPISLPGGVSTSRAARGIIADGLGGAYIGWWTRSGPFVDDDDVYAIRILANGDPAPGWPAGGYPVCVLNDVQFLTSVVADSAGGVFLAWYDHRTYPAVAYVQRLRPDGTPAPGWQQNGNRVSDLPGYHFAPRASPDGHGGVYVTFQEAFFAGGYIQHLTGSGVLAPGWPMSSVPLVYDPTDSSEQDEMQIVADGSGGAIVVWNDFRNGRQEQLYAQRYIGDGPTPVLVSLVSALALPDRVVLAWHDPSRAVRDATVYRRRDGEEWSALGHASFDGTGRLQFEDAGVSPGERYAYRLGWREMVSDYFSAETWVDVPIALALALEGARPNPAVGSFTVAFTLPQAENATLELLDVAGRRVLEREVGSLGPGQHQIRLGECGCTPPGMYWLRLTSAGRALVRRVAVVK
jgi:hypothetical protein